MNRLPSLFLFLFLISCSSGEINQNIEADINKGFQSSKQFSLSEFADSAITIKLSTGANCLISDVTKIVIGQQTIFIFDRATRKILEFDFTGNFIKQIGIIGSGSKEYKSCIDIEINPSLNILSILDEESNKLVFYSMDGNFIKSIPTKGVFRRHIWINNSTISLLSPYPLNFYSKGSIITQINYSSGKQIPIIIQKTENNSIAEGIRMFNLQKLDNNNYCYWDSYSNSLRTISPNPSVIHFVYKNTPPSQIYSKASFMNNEIKKYNTVLNVTKLAETYFITGLNKAIKRLIVYDINNKKSFYCLSPYSGGKFSIGIYDDMLLGLPFWPSGSIGDSIAYDVIEHFEIFDFLTNNSTSHHHNSKLDSLSNNLNFTSNPIIRIVYF